MWKFTMIMFLIVAPILVMGFGGCSKKRTQTVRATSSSGQQQEAAQAKEIPVAPEKNPPGDIPDNQTFVKYASSQGGYELEVPEGWARKENGKNVIFTDKLDGFSVHLSGITQKPSPDSIKNNQAEQLKKEGRAVVLGSIKNTKPANVPAVRMVYESNSEPDPVTDKQVRLENEMYFFYKNGDLAELRLWAPLGSDNVDQWKRISDSFRWR